MYILNFPFFLGINNTEYFTNNYKSLILPNCGLSFINSLSTYYSVSVNLYVKKNLEFVSNSKLIA